ncbi:HAD hydrolase family protein [Nonomuraea sp. PA05]|uniref:HAD hydrolase family protein n=1 Tax=Nonomuraea sp. PA05 TaxID=2604466 RepID=UPI0011D3366A|nr:HAD hydrolase family protein [Nonomuraea sp. PA05]TYB68457.1 HAD hydrolase family protein [Nonomuraea sp. PA05]
MRYNVLACDYDETLARNSQVDEATIEALERLSRAGFKLLLVTGRELDDLLSVFPHPALFDLIVAENGGLLYDPRQRTTDTLAAPPPPGLAERLRAEGVSPLGVGQVLIATREPHDVHVLRAIRELGLELQVIYNKGAVMVLPPGVNKATGLCAALDRLSLSRHSVVAVGDGENDHAFLTAAECGAAVANALPALKDACDLCLDQPDGRGVAELAKLLLAGDLDELDLPRHHVLLGHAAQERPDEEHADQEHAAQEHPDEEHAAEERPDEERPDEERVDERAGQEEVRLPAYGVGLLVAGPSGSGKSTVTTALLERLTGDGYQCVIVDPEGDYAEYPGVTVLGDPDRVPAVDEVVHVLEQPAHSVVINLIGLQLRDRPAYFAELLPRLTGLRAKLGHPHWLILDEAHHLMPAEVRHIPLQHPGDLGALLLITVHPDALSPAALRLVTSAIAVGKAPADTLAAFATARGLQPPSLRPAPKSDIALWLDGADEARELTLAPARVERTRHRRKYAAGTMAKDKSFYFTGPEARLRLRARNLHTFVELSEGVDDDTWLHHLRRGDYSGWIREQLGDAELADEVAAVEEADLSPQDSRQRVADLIGARYTLPAEPTDFDPDHRDR